MADNLAVLRDQHKACGEKLDRLTQRQSELSAQETQFQARRVELLRQHADGDGGASAQLDKIEQQLRIVARDREASSVALDAARAEHQQLTNALSEAERDAAQQARYARLRELQSQLDERLKNYSADHLQLVQCRAAVVLTAKELYEAGGTEAFARVAETFQSVDAGHLLANCGWRIAAPGVGIAQRRDAICAALPPK